MITTLRRQEAVPNLYASIQKHKTLWSHERVSATRERHLGAGSDAQKRLIGVEAASTADVAIKLTELLDWMADDGHPDQVAMLQSCIADLDRMAVSPQVGAVTAASFRKPRADRRARPVTMDGITYPSISAAARALGVPYEALRTSTA